MTDPLDRAVEDGFLEVFQVGFIQGAGEEPPLKSKSMPCKDRIE